MALLIFFSAVKIYWTNFPQFSFCQKKKLNKKPRKMKVVYDLVFKRTSTFAAGIMLSVFFFERTFDLASDGLFDSTNKGVRHNLNFIM